MKVAIGPIFNQFGGVSNHICAIKKYSKNQVKVVPSNFVRGILNKKERRIRLYKRVMNRTGLKGFDVFHSHADPWFTGLCMNSRDMGLGAWVHTYHLLYFEENYPDGLRPWQMETNKCLIEKASNADVKISIAHWVHDHLQERYDIETTIIPNGFDPEKTEQARAERFIRKYGIRDFVLFIGYLEPQVKNPKLFMELAAQIPDQQFVMLGKDINRQRLMEKYKVKPTDNISFLSELPHEETLDAIAACKTFVMTSKCEGIPTVLLEAMSMAKPVVGPNHTGCKEVIESKDYGFIFTSDSLEDLTDKTLKALESKNTGKNARTRVYEKYDWRVIVKKLDSVYESL